jgi:hypothetical protein
MKCSVCDKTLENELGGASVAVTVSFPAADKEPKEWVAAQMGNYAPLSLYQICFECFLRALGVPEPEPEVSVAPPTGGEK